MQLKKLEELAKLVRYFILISTTAAGSGHPTSSLSATDLMVALMFGGFFKADLDDPQNPGNDRLIFSKGHASPLFYSLYAAAGKITEEDLKTLRKFGSALEGHPTMEFAFTEAATGSLGQGLSIGLGMALNAKKDNLNYKTYILLGDSEMAEGSVWEALALASHYKLNNLVGIVDVNRLGQRGETLYGHKIDEYEKRISAFGWKVFAVDGHNISEIVEVLKKLEEVKDSPVMIVAKTLKGKGVSFLEDQDNWHGKALKEEDLQRALKELGEVDRKIKGAVGKAKRVTGRERGIKDMQPDYEMGSLVATRKAYGNAIVKLSLESPDIIVLDAEVSNSTMAESVKKENPSQFFEMFIAEQNMVGVALGFSRRGKVPFVSTFAAFFSRAFDQIRMSQYSDPNIKFVGSHAGVSIGEDGASQMALEDISMFRTLNGGVVLYPSDAVSAEKLTWEAAKLKGNVYIRTTRAETPVIYKNSEKFEIGGLKVHKAREGKESGVVVIAAGITFHEALKAQKQLATEGTAITVIDLYSVKPMNKKFLNNLVKNSKAFVTVEDHYPEGGIGEAVSSAVSGTGIALVQLAVNKIPRSGKPDELLNYEDIGSLSIIKEVKKLI